MSDTLLILGNGFDLNCGLLSSYQDYFKYRAEHLEVCRDFQILAQQAHEKYGTISIHISKFLEKHFKSLFTELKLWEMLFILESYGRDEVNWFNIEEIIQYSVTSHIDSFERVLPSMWNNIMKQVYRQGNDVTFQSSNYSTEDIISFVFRYWVFRGGDFSSEFDNLFSPRDRKKGEENWKLLLLKQLIKFESIFKEYIKNQVENNKNYSKEAMNLIDKLIASPRSIVNVINFNYTDISNINHQIYAIDNVHGNMNKDEDTIFGIDGKELSPNGFSYVFCKTYRIVYSNTFHPREVTQSVLEEGIIRIVFYGHSLNIQDYSYYQTIFDLYDLYDNRKLQLEFKYSVYNEAKKEEIKMTIVKRVTSLLVEYGKTLDNKDKGGNLVHKLINEKRLQIIEVPN